MQNVLRQRHAARCWRARRRCRGGSARPSAATTRQQRATYATPVRGRQAALLRSCRRECAGISAARREPERRRTGSQHVAHCRRENTCYSIRSCKRSGGGMARGRRGGARRRQPCAHSVNRAPNRATYARKARRRAGSEAGSAVRTPQDTPQQRGRAKVARARRERARLALRINVKSAPSVAATKRRAPARVRWRGTCRRTGRQ